MGERRTERLAQRLDVGEVLLVVAALVLFVGLRAPFLSVPLERDEGEYAYMAQRLFEGDQPYLDTFNQKPPAIFLVYAVAQVFSDSIEAFRVVAFAWSALTAVALFLLARALAGRLAGLWAALVFVILDASPTLHATAANTEVFMILPMTASIVCLVRGLSTQRLGWWVACGGLAAAAVSFKLVAGSSILCVAVFALGVPPRSGSHARAIAMRTGGLAIGALAAIAPLLGWLVAVGAWGAFVGDVILHNLEYAARQPLNLGMLLLMARLSEQAPEYLVAWTLAACGLVVHAVRGERLRLLPLVWMVSCAIGVSAGLYFREHYFIQWLPPLALGAGLALAAIHARVLASESRLASAAVSAVLCALVAVPVLVARSPTLLASSPEAISRHIYGMNPFPEAQVLGELIAAGSEPGDSVFVMGSEPEILFYAKRPSATRYILTYPLTGEYPGTMDRQRELIEQVRAARPRFIVRVNLSSSHLWTPRSNRWFVDQTEAMLAQDYVLEALAFPDTPDSFVFLRGRRARQLAARRPDVHTTDSLALFRRKARAPGMDGP